VLLGLFFITIGMLLDLASWERWPLVLLLLVPIAASSSRGHGAGAGLGAPAWARRSARRYLAQAGEFGFVLLKLAAGSTGCCRPS
jgi:monovalent cation:H+ antiporter-2, CPA2 family